jgi:hypothetical protein
MRFLIWTVSLLCAAAPVAAQQTDADAYTRYELLAPRSHKFRVLFEITATRPGATTYYNPIRPGSVASDERVIDRSTGQPLAFREVEGSVAQTGGVRSAASDSRYIEVKLARPVPGDGGESRILIDKTYEDARSYFSDGDQIVFDRSLGNKRNAVVLPRGYELVSVNVPAQVLEEADGRLKIAFWNDGAAAAPLVVRARPVRMAPPAAPKPALQERAHQDREIVYWLNDPATHSFALAHDYTETRAGIGTYVNVVRAGSSVSAPSARVLDTGASIPFEVVKGRAAVLAAAPDMQDVPEDASAVVFRFDPVKAGQSTRLRIAETYTDPERYRLEGSELVWRRSLGRPANAVVLPEGWVLTNSSVPAKVSMENGRVRLDFVNPRMDEIDTVITARRRQAP